jgi:hypothetical protein
LSQLLAYARSANEWAWDSGKACRANALTALWWTCRTRWNNWRYACDSARRFVDRLVTWQNVRDAAECPRKLPCEQDSGTSVPAIRGLSWMSVRHDPDNCDRHLALVDALRRDSKRVSQPMSPRINGGGESSGVRAAGLRVSYLGFSTLHSSALTRRETPALLIAWTVIQGRYFATGPVPAF